jgi:hypothetical protein
VKKVTAVLLVYAILVIASSVFWGWCVVSKSRLTAGGNRDNGNVTAEADNMKHASKIVTEKATELTGGVMEDVKADGQANDIVKSNDF